MVWSKSWAENRLIAWSRTVPSLGAYAVTFNPTTWRTTPSGMKADAIRHTRQRMIWHGDLHIDHTLRKFVFMFCHIFGPRPMIAVGLGPVDLWILLNWVVVWPSTRSLTCFWRSALLLALSTFFAGSIHPTAATTGTLRLRGDRGNPPYYGPLNALAQRGLRNEHHDFPSCPGAGPAGDQIAPEFC